jgi:hypothetical protein
MLIMMIMIVLMIMMIILRVATEKSAAGTSAPKIFSS